MVRRPDLILAAIPVVALSGVGAEAATASLASAAGVGAAFARLPLAVVGLFAAIAVIGYALASVPADGA